MKALQRGSVNCLPEFIDGQVLQLAQLANAAYLYKIKYSFIAYSDRTVRQLSHARPSSPHDGWLRLKHFRFVF